jgi:hypothetical protein
VRTNLSPHAAAQSDAISPSAIARFDQLTKHSSFVNLDSSGIVSHQLIKSQARKIVDWGSNVPENFAMFNW